MHVESKLATIASKHVKPQHIDKALDAYKSHLATLDPKQVAAMHADGSFVDHADAFFKGVAEGAPDLASEQSTEAAADNKSPGWAMRASKAELQRVGFGKW